MIQPLEVPIDLWPILQVFTKMSRQWRVSMGGVMGLDYTVLPWMFKLHNIEDEYQGLLDIRDMEDTALTEIAAQNSTK